MPLAETAYTQLRELILTGALAPESSITENSIVERLAIGKTPVREAMRRLVLEGLLDVTPRLGYTVVGISQQDVDDIFQLRVITEVAAAQLATERITDDALNRLEELGSVGYDPENSGSLERFLSVNAEFHDLLGSQSANRRLADLVTRLTAESRRFVQIVNLTDFHGRDVVVQHQAIVDALRSGDRDAVGDAVRTHVTEGWTLVLDSLGVTSQSSA